jgi:putative Holliday junction resolvase
MFTHIALDWGEVYIGLAYGDKQTQLVLAAKDKVDPENYLQAISDLLQNNQISEIILGYPSNVRGKPTNTSNKINDFSKELQKHFPKLDITLVDERFTTKLAKDKLNSDIPRHILNNQSAAEILNRYFQSL